MTTIIYRWSLYGFLFGLCFPLGAIALDMVLSELTVSWASVKQLHANNYLHYIIDSAPFVLGFMGCLIGIQKRRLQQLICDLETTVADRTHELAEALERAEHASQAKTRFLSSVSHELRTPLNAILGFGQLLEMEQEIMTEYQNEHVGEILTAGRHLLTLINDMLDLAKIESGRVDMCIQNTSLTEVLNQSISLISGAAKKRNLQLINHINAKPHMVKADFSRLKQIMLNLLSNAVKYSEDNGPVVLDSRVIDEHYLRISVTDSGRGLSPAEINQLFKPFVRLARHNTIEGTGIGLALSKNLIEAMGGRIGVESPAGKGCSFWVELKLADDTNSCEEEHHVTLEL
ncbi:MAG: hypothetical protein GYB20_13935 [Oceanospirillales bacterium]|nr:hypothetical protein [Oceanospirillales bacterium]MBR9888780.1 hypothetical protein [Oceanospirillales bacterium]